MIQRKLNPHNPDEAFFPVHLGSVHGERGQIIPKYHTVVDSETGNVLSVVSGKYHLITNESAYRYAAYVIEAIFPGLTIDDFTCYNIKMPKTRSFCHIDLIKMQNPYNPFGDTKESWTPFIRITNSYNKMYVLRYEIGFCRWICLNGVIFGSRSFTLSIPHIEGQRVNTGEIIRNARKSFGDITSLWNELQRNLEAARGIPVPESMILPIFCKAFDINIDPKKVKHQAMESLSAQATSILRQGREYFHELGSNAYAMFNVLTDFSSYPVGVANVASQTHSYQKKSGLWLQEFVAESKKKSFSLYDYIGKDYMDSAIFLESLSQFNKLPMKYE